MKFLFFISGDYIELGRQEVIHLFQIKKPKYSGRIIVSELNDSILNSRKQRLALTKKIYKVLFECNRKDLIKSVKEFDWNSIFEKSFCVRSTKLKNAKSDYSEKQLASHIWRKLNNPKVDLENAKTNIEFFVSREKIHCGLLQFENHEEFESRKSHKRPFPHPSSLHPKIARALVNITGIKENEILLDPFCGMGGLLIESSLMGIKSVGYDISKIMAEGCKQNLKFFKIKNSRVMVKNALNIDKKFDYVATDLPYGLNSNVCTSNENGDWKDHRLNRKIDKKDFEAKLEIFYLKFLVNLRKKLRKKAVIVFPNYVDYRKLLKKSKFKIEKEFSNYVHKSLTRKIVKMS